MEVPANHQQNFKKSCIYPNGQMDNVMSGTGKWSLGYLLLDQQWSLAGHLTPFVDDLDSYSSG